jgi:alpha-1,2-glucosyltransferase
MINQRYLVSKLSKPLLGCETSSLRMVNAEALCVILIMSYGILRLLRKRDNLDKSLSGDKEVTVRNPHKEHAIIPADVHSALNIALFPPLLFFSALYYTDVMSTLAVLLAYYAYLANSTSNRTVMGRTSAVTFGVLALLFRQTNIFWVAVFPAGLAVVGALKEDAPSTSSTTPDPLSVIQTAWSDGIIYDCSVQDAGLQGKLCHL